MKWENCQIKTGTKYSDLILKKLHKSREKKSIAWISYNSNLSRSFYQWCYKHKGRKLFYSVLLKQVSWRLFNLPLVNTQSNILFSISVTKFTAKKTSFLFLYISSYRSKSSQFFVWIFTKLGINNPHCLVEYWLAV